MSGMSGQALSRSVSTIGSSSWARAGSASTLTPTTSVLVLPYSNPVAMNSTSGTGSSAAATLMPIGAPPVTSCFEKTLPFI
jgi:hypothetical protein